MHGISKRFGATRALDDVALELRRGEVHALVGENGAGKSTLIKIMTGVHAPDEGEMLVDGQPVTLRNAADAQARGIAAIYQEPLIFPDLNVAENIFIGHRDQGRVVHWRQMYADAAAILARLDVHLEPRHAGQRTPRCRPAGDRDRQSNVPRRARAHHGRADGSPVGPRGRSAVPASTPTPRRGRRGVVHQPPAR